MIRGPNKLDLVALASVKEVLRRGANYENKLSFPLLVLVIAGAVFALSLSGNRAANDRGSAAQSKNEQPQAGRSRAEAPALVPGPDVIVGDLPDMAQFGSAGTQVGLGIATTSCNNGDQPLDWFALPNTDHPVIPQNLYRMSGGADNTERFEQIGQSWMKHGFGALEEDACGLGCNVAGCNKGVQLCPGCSDPYFAGTNADQLSNGSRAWVNPFTGSFPSNANDHSAHVHDGVSHRVIVEADDLNTMLNQGTTYFAEAAYITPPGSPTSHLRLLVQRSECNLPSERGQARQLHRLSQTRETMASSLSLTR